MTNTETTTPAINGAAEARDWLPAALRPRAEEDARAQRASRLVATLCEHARSPLVEPHFVEGSRGLALALTGLAAMRANRFAVQLTEELAERLEPVLQSAEAQIEAALPTIADADAARRRNGRRAARPSVREPASTRA